MGAASGALAPGPDGWEVWVRIAGRWEWLIPPAAVAQRERRRGSTAPMLRARVARAGSDLSEPVRQLVPAQKDVEIAAFGLGVNGRGMLHVGKQESSDDEAARNLPGYRRRLRGETWPRPPRSGATGRVFSNAPVHGFQVPLPLLSGYRISLTCRPKLPTPDNHSVKSISGAPRSGCPS